MKLDHRMTVTRLVSHGANMSSGGKAMLRVQRFFVEAEGRGFLESVERRFETVGAGKPG